MAIAMETRPMEPKFQVQLKIRKPAAEVFDAVVRPEALSSYFVQAASGPLKQGATVKWSFAEAPTPFDVVVREVVDNERIVFDWPASKGAPNTLVEMVFKSLDDGTTMVQISEAGWRADKAGVKASYGNAGGWMHMMCCLKAYLEYDINLRAGGAF
jgi:uncharacterized protein YndB with AHSA1/START domain